MSNWRQLPQLRNDSLLFIDTSGFPLPGKIVPCLLCGDAFLMRQYVGTPDQLCEDCSKTYKEAATVICKNCKIAICKVKPGVLDNGFVIRKQQVLHSSSCNICQYGLQQSEIVEITNWERTLRRAKPCIIVPPSYKKDKT